MARSLLKKPDDRPQIDRFREIASKLGCNEDEGAFKANLAVIARHKLKVNPGQKNLKKDTDC